MASSNDEFCVVLDRLLGQTGGLKELARDEALKERLALAHMQASSDWFDIKDVLRKHKMVRDVCAIAIAKSRELQGVASIGVPRDGTPVREIWPDAPVSDDATIPSEYGAKHGRAAIYRREIRNSDAGGPQEKKITVSYDPVFISGRIQQRETSRQLLRLTWKIGRSWHSEMFDRDDVFSSRDIVKTAAFGVPVGSDNAFEIVQFLRAYEHENRSSILPCYATSQLGWIGDDESPTKHGFMCGTTQIGANGKVFELRTVGPGEADEAKQIHSKGDFSAWKKAVMAFEDWPVVRLLVYAMLAPPLQPIVDGPNAIVETVRRTSKSKTYAVMMAQSVWRKASVWPRTWDNTLNNFESLANLFSGIPLILDDTMLCVKNRGQQGEELIGKAIYKFVAGVGRGRDTKEGGQRHIARWRTVLISTGETPSSDLAHAEGAAARVLSFWADPTGPIDPAVGAKVDELVNHDLSRHYGHAGPHVVKWLHEHRDMWDTIREQYDECVVQVREMFKTPAGTRLARVVALLDVAAAVGSLSGALPWKPISILDDPTTFVVIKQAIDQASSGADRARAAWIHVMSYAEARPDQWVSWGCEPGYGDGDDDHKKKEPPGGWLGWRRVEWLGWLPSQLRKALGDGGFNPEMVLRAWLDAGVIEPGPARYPCGGPAGPDGGRRRLYLLRSCGTPWE